MQGWSWKQPKELKLPFGQSSRTVWAGSYKTYPGAGFFGVKLAPEIRDKPAHMVIPIKDFGLPTSNDAYSALRVILYRVALGQRVYLGCMGGLGRTGTMLSLLYRALGVQNSVDYVRQIYDKSAVETRDQERFVRQLFIGPVRYDVLRAKYTACMLDARRAGRLLPPYSNGQTPRVVDVDWSVGPEVRSGA